MAENKEIRLYLQKCETAKTSDIAEVLGLSMARTRVMHVGTAALFQKHIQRHDPENGSICLVRARQDVDIKAFRIRHAEQRQRLVPVDPVNLIIIRRYIRLPRQTHACIHGFLVKFAVQHLYIAHGACLFRSLLCHCDISEPELHIVRIFIRRQFVGDCPDGLSRQP